MELNQSFSVEPILKIAVMLRGEGGKLLMS